MGDIVVECLGVEKGAGFLELVDDELVGVPYEFAFKEFGDGVVVAAVGAGGVVDLQAISLGGVIIFLAVAGSSVDKAGPVFEGDVVGEDDRASDRKCVGHLYDPER